MNLARSRAIAEEVRALLVERWPYLFAAKDSAGPRLPLKIGIAEDLIAALPDVKPAHIKIALRRYTTRRKYLETIQPGFWRHGLVKGEPAGEVTKKEAEHAQGRLAALKREREKRSANKTAPST
jgi:sRNA-binding protein